MLPLLGYDFILTSDGREALDVFTAKPDRCALALLDLSMPNLGGAEALEMMRRLRSDLPVVLMSGYDMNKAVQRIPSDKLSAFLPKPFSLQDLRIALQRAIG
jgi:CheY-like chemotaxis protein